MKSYYDNNGKFHIDVYLTDSASEVALKVEKNRAPGTAHAANLLVSVAQMNSDLSSELKVDFASYTADGSELWFIPPIGSPQQVRTGDEYVTLISKLL